MEPRLLLRPVTLALGSLLAGPAVVEPVGPGTPPIEACEPVTHVSEVAELVAMMPRPLGDTITNDLHATASIILEPEAFPPSVTGAAVSLRARGTVAGVARNGGSRVEIAAGTLFRMRFTLIMGHPPGFRVNAVTVEAACSSPCATNERRCAADRICYAKGRELCQECDRFADDRCACVGPDDHALPDGTDCTFAPPMSMPMLGTCKAGTCRWPRATRP